MTPHRRTHLTVLALLVLAGSAAADTAPPQLKVSTEICSPAPTPLSGSAAVARNVETVRAVYAAFAAGKVEPILGCVSDKAEWESWADNHAQRANVPWLKAQKGREGVAKFFAYVGSWKVNTFAVKNMMAAGNNVAAEIEVDFLVTQTGARLQDQEIHYWTFDDRGMITGLRHYNDTAKHIAAAKAKR